jgi:hypothetical protein
VRDRKPSILVLNFNLNVSLHFKEVNYVAAFQEYEFELKVSEDGIAEIISGWESCGSAVPYSNGEDDDA